ncbi:membrane protein [Flavonifractor sp. An92]|uniref:YitT family protein n=1 Tax=Flavonifractor sp. An92 TaxID=1965666 RepID=UPI000B391C71|nr:MULTISPECIES: YitT family protein [unclassified Flavonifractor]OUN05601.1 membrane protein [Flavonifractor sp. An92]OUQ23029.1 membrane protein [Flavonifractor sp. An135]
MKNTAKRLLISYFWITVGSLVYALGFDWCYAPNAIGFGGITGLAQIINAVLPWAPIGTVVIVLNIPLFFLGWRLLGGHLLLSSLYAMFISSVFVDVIAALVPFQPMDPMLATIFGGILVGLSLGIILLQGATTGGTDLLARLLKLRFAWLPMGKLLMVVDLAVIVAVAAAFRNLSSALYGVVSLYIFTAVMDMVLYGLDSAKVAYIISSKPDEISKVILDELDRGITILHGEGGWSGDPKKVLLCAFKQKQIVPLRRMVKEIDPEAFLIVCDAHEVLGDGFRSYQQNDL